MSEQGPVIVVSTERQALAAALGDAALFPVIDVAWADASRAVEQLRPVAVVAMIPESGAPGLGPLAKQIAAVRPYLPLIAIDPGVTVPENAIPFLQAGSHFDRLAARLHAALRVRTLSATVMRRLDNLRAPERLCGIDPVRDATVLLIGRGSTYPALSVALGERTGILGALSIEVAAKHLNTRDIDGIVLGDGFTPRVTDAFLTVLAEDARFRNLPVVVSSDGLTPTHDLPNLEFVSGSPERIAALALPLARQHALEMHLRRTLRSIDADGLLDVRCGLLTAVSFHRDLATAVRQTLSGGGDLSVARFAFDRDQARAQLDGARILSRLIRQTDFGAAQDDGSILVAFTETDLRNAQMIARRLASVMRHTSHGRRRARSEPVVTFAALKHDDSAASLLARLNDRSCSVAS